MVKQLVIILFSLGLLTSCDDHACLYENAPAHAEWWQKLEDHDYLSVRLNVCKQSRPYRETFIRALTQAVDENLPPYLPDILPENTSMADNTTWLNISEDTAQKLKALKEAHLTWLELAQKLPWSLLDMTDDMRERVFTHHELYKRDDGQNYINYLIYDNPRWAWNYVQQNLLNRPLDETSPEDIVLAIVRSLRSFVHGNNNTDGVRVASLEEMTNAKKSYHGCHSVAVYTALMAKTFLLPVSYETGWFTQEHLHGSILFPMTNYFMAHGDDVYNWSLTAVPTEELMTTYNYFEAEIFPRGRLTAETDFHARQHTIHKAMQYPSEIAKRQYCRFSQEQRISYLRAYYQYADSALADQYKQILEAHCQSLI